MFRIGHSRDIHKLGPNRKLILGTVEIPYELGLIGHSDADCLSHAIAESIIGALGLGDLGKHFPDTDMKYKDMPSSYFLLSVKELLVKNNFKIVNLDCTIMAEKPMMNPYIPKINTSEITKYAIPASHANTIFLSSYSQLNNFTII